MVSGGQSDRAAKRDACLIKWENYSHHQFDYGSTEPTSTRKRMMLSMGAVAAALVLVGGAVAYATGHDPVRSCVGALSVPCALT